MEQRHCWRTERGSAAKQIGLKLFDPCRCVKAARAIGSKGPPALDDSPTARPAWISP